MKGILKRQTGSTLLISLVLLVMLTLFVLTVVNTTNINIRIAGNVQSLTEAQNAVQAALEQIISTPTFSTNPTGVPSTISVNTGNNKTYTVNVTTPTCTSIVPIKTTELNISDSRDAACLGSGSAVAAGIVGAGGSGNSLCSNSQWDITAGVSETATTGLNVTVHQGVAVRVPVGTAC